MFALPIYTARAVYRHAVASVRWTLAGILPNLSYRKSSRPKSGALCSRYLFSRPVTRQLSSAYVCLTSVFGMGTGGPTQQSTRTLLDGVYSIFYISNAFALDNLGDPYRIRTDVNGVRGRCLNHLTNGPLVQLQGLEPGTH